MKILNFNERNETLQNMHTVLHSAIDLFEIRIWKKPKEIASSIPASVIGRMNIVFHHRGCGQNSMVPDRQIQRMSLCFHRNEKITHAVVASGKGSFQPPPTGISFYRS